MLFWFLCNANKASLNFTSVPSASNTFTFKKPTEDLNMKICAVRAP